MKGNGLERDTIDGVITDLEALDAKWLNGHNQMSYATLRDALYYLREYKAVLERPFGERLIDVLREVRGEK